MITPFLISAGDTAATATSSGALPVSWLDLALGAVAVGVAIALSLWYHIGFGRQLVIGALRAVVQLVAVGYILVALFLHAQWYWTLLALIVMLIAAAFTATGRRGNRGASHATASRATASHATRRQRLFTINAVALLLGAGLTLAYVDVVVITVRPWYDPRYLIPLFGMIVSNAMNGAALAAERLESEIAARRGEIEAYLALGASSKRAARNAVRAALRAAFLPSVNSLAIVGIVSLPGMMTGQILAGSSPLLAVRYQIVVVFMLTGAVALSAAIVATWYRRTFFTAAEQLTERIQV
jgi:putative ABC transport system permease protein